MGGRLLKLVREAGTALSPFGEKAVTAYEALPGVADWDPEVLQPIQTQRILQNGWPLAHINTIRHKAERLQSDGHNAFLVMADQPTIPARHKKWATELTRWLPQWPRVSGVICFDRRPYIFSDFCWHLSAHINPHACNALPHDLRQQLQSGELDLRSRIYA